MCTPHMSLRRNGSPRLSIQCNGKLAAAMRTAATMPVDQPADPRGPPTATLVTAIAINVPWNAQAYARSVLLTTGP
jgi:hypothetical protein